VSETKKDNAQVSTETTIKADQRNFIPKTERRPGDVMMSTTGVGTDAAVGPTVGT
jgi:cysteine desulfurase